jgi:hypothetical protein
LNFEILIVRAQALELAMMAKLRQDEALKIRYKTNMRQCIIKTFSSDSKKVCNTKFPGVAK